jgi:hypothetical protein
MTAEEVSETLAMAADDATLGLTAWRAALRRELRALWQDLDRRPVISGPNHLTIEDMRVRQMDWCDREPPIIVGAGNREN